MVISWLLLPFTQNFRHSLLSNTGNSPEDHKNTRENVGCSPEDLKDARKNLGCSSEDLKTTRENPGNSSEDLKDNFGNPDPETISKIMAKKRNYPVKRRIPFYLLLKKFFPI